MLNFIPKDESDVSFLPPLIPAEEISKLVKSLTSRMNEEQILDYLAQVTRLDCNIERTEGGAKVTLRIVPAIGPNGERYRRWTPRN